MSYQARATRDSRGMSSICGGLFLDELKAHSLGETEQDIFRIKIKQKRNKLVELLDLPGFNLLASRLINFEGYLPDTIAYAGRESGIVAISTDKRQYRARGDSIYEQKK